MSHLYHPHCGCDLCGRKEQAAERAEQVRAELIAQPDFIAEAMQEVGDSFAAAYTAGNAEVVIAAIRAALHQYADSQRDAYQRQGLVRCSDEAAYSHLLAIYRRRKAA